VRIVVGARDVAQASGGVQVPQRNVGGTDNFLRTVKGKGVRIGGKIQPHGVGAKRYADVVGDDLVVHIVFLKRLVLVHGRTVGQVQRFPDIVFNVILVGLQGKKQFVKPFYMVAGFGIRAISRDFPLSST